MRTHICIVACLLLAGCVTSQPPPPSADELRTRSEQAAAACRAQPLTTYVERAQCLNQAAMIAASAEADPDLFHKLLAARLSIAQRVDNKQITPTEGAKEYSKIQAQLTAEAKNRMAETQ
jgi:hypothetical protein